MIWTRQLPWEAFAALEGQTFESRWIALPQSRITEFALVTEDDQFFHTDPARAVAEGPFGGTIAHGFLSLSLLSAMAFDGMPVPQEAGAALNYGLDGVRFLAPVPAGARIRGRFTLGEITEKATGHLLRYGVVVEIEGQDKPALVAEWLVLFSRP